MLLGKIFGKVTTTDFRFLVEGQVKKFDYVQVYHEFYEYVLCQVIELEKQESSTVAHCQVIGFKDKDGKIKKLRIPFEPGTEILAAEDEFIKSVIELEDLENGAYLGKLEGRDIKVYLDLKKLLTKHVAIMAKSGSGKSYTVGVLLEEIIDKRVPLLIIDPHGEYSSMKNENTHEKEIEKMPRFEVKPQGFDVVQYGDTTINQDVRPLRLPSSITPQELVELLPVKLSSSQLGLLYSATQNLETVDFEQVLYNLGQEESNAKWNVMTVIEQLKNLNLFSQAHTPYHELIRSGGCSIINLRGIDPDIQDIIVYKLTKDLFELRKQNKLPPFFMVVEEAHNYCPERSFGEKKSSKILRSIASEGRKFGLGLAIISQRPARVDKSVISQCSTQIIMKVTNPNDLKAISSSVEGITSSTEREIQEISVGTALVTGITDVPLFVSVRPRMSLHGGHAVDILNIHKKEESDLVNQVKEFEDKDILPLIKPVTTAKDIELSSEEKIDHIETELVPVYIVTCKEDDQYKLLVNGIDGTIIVDKETSAKKLLPALDQLSKKELKILQAAYQLKQFTTVDLVHHLGIHLDMSTELNSLLQKGYLIHVHEKTYALDDRYIFTKLSKYKVFEEIAYEQINYTHKYEYKLSIDEVLTTLQKFTDVVDHAKAYLVHYKAVLARGK